MKKRVGKYHFLRTFLNLKGNASLHSHFWSLDVSRMFSLVRLIPLLLMLISWSFSFHANAVEAADKDMSIEELRELLKQHDEHEMERRESSRLKNRLYNTPWLDLLYKLQSKWDKGWIVPGLSVMGMGYSWWTGKEQKQQMSNIKEQIAKEVRTKPTNKEILSKSPSKQQMGPNGIDRAELEKDFPKLVGLSEAQIKRILRTEEGQELHEHLGILEQIFPNKILSDDQEEGKNKFMGSNPKKIKFTADEDLSGSSITLIQVLLIVALICFAAILVVYLWYVT